MDSSVFVYCVTSTPATWSRGLTRFMLVIWVMRSAMPAVENASSRMGITTSSAATNAAAEAAENAGGQSMSM